MDGILTFLGNSSDSGFLKAAGDLLDSADTGVLSSATESVNNQIVDQNKRIDDTQARIDLLCMRP